MGYSVFKFGALCLDGKIQPIPQIPERDGDIPQYDGKAIISFGASGPEGSITWIKPNDSNFLVADRALLANVSYEDLNKSGFIVGRPVLIDGQFFRCRLLQAGESKSVPNEWDRTLDETGEDDALWHWNKMFFWGFDIATLRSSYRAVRGYLSARRWYCSTASNRDFYVGFRPVLEPIPSSSPTPNINLDGIAFQLTSLPGGDGFCPVLQPTQENVFKDIPIGGKVRMYTLTEDGRPVHMNERVKDSSKLILTDRYFGDEYLIPWVISNGAAVASQSLLQQGKSQKERRSS